MPWTFTAASSDFATSASIGNITFFTMVELVKMTTADLTRTSCVINQGASPANRYTM